MKLEVVFEGTDGSVVGRTKDNGAHLYVSLAGAEGARHFKAIDSYSVSRDVDGNESLGSYTASPERITSNFLGDYDFENVVVTDED